MASSRGLSELWKSVHFLLDPAGRPIFLGEAFASLAASGFFGLRPLFLGTLTSSFVSVFFVTRLRAPVPCAVARIFALVAADGRLSFEGALDLGDWAFAGPDAFLVVVRTVVLTFVLEFTFGNFTFLLGLASTFVGALADVLVAVFAGVLAAVFVVAFVAVLAVVFVGAFAGVFAEAFALVAFVIFRVVSLVFCLVAGSFFRAAAVLETVVRALETVFLTPVRTPRALTTFRFLFRREADSSVTLPIFRLDPVAFLAVFVFEVDFF